MERTTYTIGTWIVEHATQQVCQVVAVEATATNRPLYSLSSGSAGLHEHELDAIVAVHRCDVYSYARMCHTHTVFYAKTSDESFGVVGEVAVAIERQLADAAAALLNATSDPPDAPTF